MGSVNAILTGVVDSLLDNPIRRFSWAEQKYFTMWWNKQSEVKKNQVRYLVMQKQLVFVNGGWVANDEACPNYQDILTNYIVGQNFIKKEFGEEAIPKIGWYLDSFGHSKTNQRLIRELGMEAMFAARQDQREEGWRKQHKQNEFMWQFGRDPSQSIFTHILYRHYESPEFMKFASYNSRARPIVPD